MLRYTNKYTQMTNKKVIEYNLDFYIVDQDLYEPDEVFYTRVWYILSNLNSTSDFDILVKKSRITVNKQFYECEYSFSDQS